MKINNILHTIIKKMTPLFYLLLFFFLYMISYRCACFLTSLIYTHINIYPSSFINDVFNFFIGFIIAILIMAGLTSKKRTQSSEIVKSVLNVLDNISKGEFNVSVDLNQDSRGFFNNVIESVNTVAKELNKMDKMRQEFVSNVSHEIQSPLTSIRGFTQALRNDELTKSEKDHYIDIIEAESIRLSRLSENMLKLASLDSGTTITNNKEFRLDKLIKDIVITMEPQWSKKEIELIVNIQECTISSDIDLINQVLINILQNSIKFTPQKGNISIDMAITNTQIKVSITDSGIGISEDDICHIFERFYKTDKSREYSNKGSGLGLSIVKKIVDLLNGSIFVESQYGKGSIFTVILPIDKKAHIVF